MSKRYLQTTMKITLFNGGGDVKPHPDGQPWTKCCGDKNDCMCAFRREKYWGARLDISKTGNPYHGDNLDGTVDKTPFFCVHRTVDGFHRVCAGWHSCFGRKLKDVE